MLLRLISAWLGMLVLIGSVFTQAGFDQAAFNAYAQQYGNKAANLHELSKIAQDIQAQVPIEVPPFFAVSNQTVIDFLKNVPDGRQSVYAGLMNDWQEFKKAQSGSSKALGEEAKKNLTQIRDRILRAFENKQFTLSSDQQKQLNEFLTSVASKDQRLMVRSTGREDTQELANAGGNESIASVNPDIKSVSQAMGRVIASYFSEQSIGQRIAAGDKQLFDDPFMPVLFQVMIGEKPGGSKVIPVSGVMFSQEAEGRTPDVAQIQTTYGQGEGVVNGLVPVDTFYVGPTKIIHPLITIKNDRIITAQEGKTSQSKENPRELQRIPSLTKIQIDSLKIAADNIQRYYGYPVDIEFVVQGGKIYLVQVRPLQEPKTTPSYIKSAYFDGLKSNSKQDVFVIGAAGGKVRTITSAQNMIIADNIRIALNKEFLPSANKDQIEAIIIGEMAPATSHEATNFRANGKPVVFVEDIARFRSWVEGGTYPILLDAQRASVVRFEPQEHFNSPESVIEENAWFAHPIPPHVSIFRVLYTPLTEEQAKLIAPHMFFPEKTLAELLTLMKDGNREESIKSGRTMLAHLATRIAKEKSNQAELKKAKKETNPRLIEQLELLSKQLASAVYELIMSLDAWSKSAQTMQDRLIRLYPVRFIEALLKQIPYTKLFVNDYSAASLLKTEDIEKEIVGELELSGNALRAFIAQYAKASEYALTDDVKRAWQKFLKEGIGAIDAQLQGKFAQLIHSLGTLNVLPLWLNSIFYHAAQKYDNPTELTQSLVQDYTGDAAFIGKLTLLNKKLTTFDSAAFELPDRFEQQWKRLQIEFYAYFTSDEFLKSYNEAQVLAKMIALSVMNQFVSVFDTSIKAVTGSTAYGNAKEKVTRFKQMLESYGKLMFVWGGFIDEQVMYQQFLSPDVKSFEEYFKEKIQSTILSAPYTPDQLNGSPTFNVPAATLGSRVYWFEPTVGKDPTLEDMFTLIHQNILVLVSFLFKDMVPEMPVPPLFARVIERVKQLKFDFIEGASSGAAVKGVVYGKIDLIGAEFNYPYLTYRFNIPLRQHSTMINIVYDMKKNRISFGGQFIGEGHYTGRWVGMHVLLGILAQLGGIELVRPVSYGDRFLEYAVYVNNDQDVDRIVQMHTLLVEECTSPQVNFMNRLLDAIFGNHEKAAQSNELLLKELYNYPEQANNLLKKLASDAFDAADPKNLNILLSLLGGDPHHYRSMIPLLASSLEYVQKMTRKMQSDTDEPAYDLSISVDPRYKNEVYSFTKSDSVLTYGGRLPLRRLSVIPKEREWPQFSIYYWNFAKSFANEDDGWKAAMLYTIVANLANIQLAKPVSVGLKFGRKGMNPIEFNFKRANDVRVMSELYGLIEEKLIGKKDERGIVAAVLQNIFGNLDKIDELIDLVMRDFSQHAYLLLNEILYVKKYNYADPKVKEYLDHIRVWFAGLTDTNAEIAQSFKKVVEAVNREHPLPKEFMADFEK